MPLLHKSLIALALAGILALPLLRLDADASAPAAEAPPAMVSVAPAVRTDFAPRHWAPGSIISRRDARVASELEGRVLQMTAQGCRLVEVDDFEQVRGSDWSAWWPEGGQAKAQEEFGHHFRIAHFHHAHAGRQVFHGGQFLGLGRDVAQGLA